MYSEQTDKQARNKMIQAIINRYSEGHCITKTFINRCNGPYTSKYGAYIVFLYHDYMNL